MLRQTINGTFRLTNLQTPQGRGEFYTKLEYPKAA